MAQTRKEKIMTELGASFTAFSLIIYGIFQKQGRTPLVIYLSIGKAEIFRRLRFRYYCSKTGEPLILKTSKLVCPKHGDKVIKRADDDQQAIRNRIAYYDRVYSKTVKFWRQKRLLRKINGKQSVVKVTKDIIGAVRDFYGAR